MSGRPSPALMSLLLTATFPPGALAVCSRLAPPCQEAFGGKTKLTSWLPGLLGGWVRGGGCRAAAGLRWLLGSSCARMASQPCWAPPSRSQNWGREAPGPSPDHDFRQATSPPCLWTVQQGNHPQRHSCPSGQTVTREKAFGRQRDSMPTSGATTSQVSPGLQPKPRAKAEGTQRPGEGSATEASGRSARGTAAQEDDGGAEAASPTSEAGSGHWGRPRPSLALRTCW